MYILECTTNATLSKKLSENWLSNKLPRNSKLFAEWNKACEIVAIILWPVKKVLNSFICNLQFDANAKQTLTLNQVKPFCEFSSCFLDGQLANFEK